jgi:hypothetical protein
MRLRPSTSLEKDPDFWLNVGRIVGLVEGHAWNLLQGKMEAEDQREIGQRMLTVSGWFLEKDEGWGGKTTWAVGEPGS